MPFGIVAAFVRLDEVAALKNCVRLQVALGGHKYLDDVLGAVLLNLRHPTVQVLEGAPASAVIG